MPKVEEKVVIGNSADLQHHFDSIIPTLQLLETEDSWLKIEKSLIKLEIITKSGGYKFDLFPILFKSVAQSIINSLLSERTKLSGTATDLINSVAPRLGERFEILNNIFSPCLLSICARTNKVALFRAKKCLLLIAKHCKLPSLLPHLREASKDKSQTMRIVSVEVTMMLLEVVESRERIGKRVEDLEVIIKGTATDRDPEVRQWCKRVFETYVDRWSERAALFTASFTPTTRRYLAVPKAAISSCTTVSSRAAISKPLASPAKRVEVIEKPRQRPASHIIKASLPSNTYASTSYGSSLTPAAPSHFSTSTRGGQVRVPKTGSGLSTGLRAAPTSSTADGENQRSSHTDPHEDERLSTLRAELLKQATGTPSQGLAARLALEQFEFRLRKKRSQKFNEDTCEQDENRDPTPFNVAMAKKQSPLKKAPSRIIVAPPPTIRKISSDTIKPAQRIISNVSIDSGKGKTKGTVEEIHQHQHEDVFRSRPIEKAQASTPKKTSSISRSMSAREKLLGSSSMSAANRAKAMNVRGNMGGKKAGLKVDIGKENIPPGSKLANIAASTTTHGRSQLRTAPPKVTPAVEEAAVAAVEKKLEDVVLAEEAIEREVIIVEGEISEEASRLETVVGTDIPSDSPLEAASPSQIPAASTLVIDDAVNGGARSADSAFEDWSKVVESLADDIPLSASKSNSSLRSAGPSMSTPVRKPLCAIQDNKSQSSPVMSLSKSKGAKVLLDISLLSPLEPPKHESIAVQQEKEEEAVSAEHPLAAKRTMVLAPSRKI